MSLYSRLRMHLPNMNSLPVNPRLPEIRVSRRPSSLFTPFSRKAHFSRRPTRVFRAVSPFALFPSRRRARVRHQRARARRRWRRRRPLLSPATRRRKTTASMPTDDQVSSTERRLLGPPSTLVASFRSRLVFFLLFGQGVPLPR